MIHSADNTTFCGSRDQNFAFMANEKSLAISDRQN